MSGSDEWKRSLSTLHRRRATSRQDADHKLRSSDSSSQQSVLGGNAAVEVDDGEADCELIDPALTAYQSLTPAFKMRSKKDDPSSTSPRYDAGRTERLMEFTSQAWDRLGASPSLGSSTFLHETPFRGSRPPAPASRTPDPVVRRAEPKHHSDEPAEASQQMTPLQVTPANRPKTSPPSTTASSKVTTPSGLRMGDEWKEARLDDGRIYYYNRRTRKSSWSLPATAIIVRVGNTEKIFVPASPSDAVKPQSDVKTITPATEQRERAGEMSSAGERSARQLTMTPNRSTSTSRPFTTPVIIHSNDGQQVLLATPEDDNMDEHDETSAPVTSMDKNNETRATPASARAQQPQRAKPDVSYQVATIKGNEQYHVDLESEEEAVHALETRRQLFTEDSFAVTNVFCVFCGLHVPLPDLANHFTNCLVFERIRDTDIHEQLQMALATGGVVKSANDEDADEGSSAMETCPECGRNFAKGRLDGHMRVCKRVFKEKRPAYDATHKRLQGTPMQYYEPFQAQHESSPARSRSNSMVHTPARYGRENAPNTAPPANTINSMGTAPAHVTPCSPPRDLIGKMPTVTESPSKPTPISIALLDETDLHPDSDVESQAVESACPFCQRVLSKATLSSHLLSCRKLKNIRAKRNGPTPRKISQTKSVNRRTRASTTVTPMKYR